MFRVFVIGLISLVCTPGFPQDLDARFAQFQLQKAESSDRMSVLIEKVSILDILTKVPTLDRSGKVVSSVMEKQLTSMRTLQRVVFGANGKRKRVDGIEYSLFGSGALGKEEREAQLIHEHQGWYCTISPRGPRKVNRFEVKAGIYEMLTQTCWKHPFSIATSGAGSMMNDKETQWIEYKMENKDEETLKDGRTRMLVSNDHGGVLRLTYNREEWFCDEIEFLEREMPREEEQALARGGRPKPVTKEMLKEYKTYATNRTEWKEIEGKRWVPMVTRISSKLPNGHAEYEIRYRDWKFADDVNESLLDEAFFTPEKIADSIDFEAIRQMFDSTK